MKNRWALSRVSPVQYSPRRQSRWVLADYGGKDLWKRWVLSMEWNSECVMESESGVHVGGELESVISSAGCFVQGWWNETGRTGSNKPQLDVCSNGHASPFQQPARVLKNRQILCSSVASVNTQHWPHVNWATFDWFSLRGQIAHSVVITVEYNTCYTTFGYCLLKSRFFLFKINF